MSQDPFDYHQVQAYLETLVPPRPQELVAMEAYAAEHDFPIIGPVAGHYCYQIARLIGARRVFELGSGYGYSTAWFARAVRENGGGEVHHVVWDEGLSQQARRHLEALGVGHLVRYHVAEAIDQLTKSAGPFDLIFLDIDKQHYPDALPYIVEKLRRGGVLIVDNMLWHARIFDPADRSDSTEGIRTLTRTLTEDPAWITTLAPLRDGLIVAYRQ
jgi:caffeoyl-CoA O-methyltransferase